MPVILLLLLVLAFPARADDLLGRIDAYRMPRRDIVATVEVVEVAAASGQPTRTSPYRVYLDRVGNSLVEMQAPMERGRRVLMTDEAVWLFIPTSERPIRITPLQRLLGQANYGDVGRMAWTDGYRVAAVEEATGLDRPDFGPLRVAMRRLGGHPMRKLSLEATSPTATYPRITLWASALDDAPVRADYFLTSGKRLKTGWFSEPERDGDGAAVRSVVFHDEAAPDLVTVMTTRTVEPRLLPASAFTVRGFTTQALR